MKKTTFFLFLCGHLSFAQSVIIDPDNGFDFIRTNLNAPGYIHKSMSSNGARLAITIKDDGPYLESSNNKPLFLIVGDNSYSMEAQTNGNIKIANYTKMGIASPYIKYKKLTATSFNTNRGCVTVNHNIDAGKIISVSAIMKYNTGSSYVKYYPSGSNQFSVSYDFAQVYLCSEAPLPTLISQEFKILITYQQ